MNEYLEPDGYFFIRLLASNASDFIVQEIIEQLWARYVMKYGEADAKRAEDAFFEFREQPNFAALFSQSPSRIASTNERYTDAGVGLLSATANVFQPIPEQNEQV